MGKRDNFVKEGFLGEGELRCNIKNDKLHCSMSTEDSFKRTIVDEARIVTDNVVWLNGKDFITKKGGSVGFSRPVSCKVEKFGNKKYVLSCE